jgi:DNA-binding response OmpR family regulator
MNTSSQDNRSKVVLGVDDDPTNLEFLKLTLMAGGYSFVGASSGEQCVSLVLRVPPRLILLDVQMPGMDGFQTCQRLRQMKPLDAVPVAFLTARKSREDVRMGMSVGGNDFIVKPFLRDRLLERVHHWTNRRIEAPKPSAVAAPAA